MTEPEIVVVVVRYRHRHESHLGRAKVVQGPAYVLAHHDARDFLKLTAGLAMTGHAFRVEIEEQEISLIDMAEHKANARRGGK